MKLRKEKMTKKERIQRIRINQTNSEGNNTLLNEEYDGNVSNKSLNLLYKLKDQNPHNHKMGYCYSLSL